VFNQHTQKAVKRSRIAAYFFIRMLSSCVILTRFLGVPGVNRDKKSDGGFAHPQSSPGRQKNTKRSLNLSYKTLFLNPAFRFRAPAGGKNTFFLFFWYF